MLRTAHRLVCTLLGARAMNRLLVSALLLLLVSATVHCAASTDDATAPAIDVSIAPNAIGAFSTGETSEGDSLEKKAEGGTKEPYMKLELNNTLVTSY
jgi:hypothetical protein